MHHAIKNSIARLLAGILIVSMTPVHAVAQTLEDGSTDTSPEWLEFVLAQGDPKVVDVINALLDDYGVDSVFEVIDVASTAQFEGLGTPQDLRDTLETTLAPTRRAVQADEDVVGSDAYLALVESAQSAIEDPVLMLALHHAMNEPSSLRSFVGPDDVVEDIVLVFTALAAGIIVSVACTPPITVATCAPAVLLAGTILVIENQAFDAIDEIEAENKLYHTDSMTVRSDRRPARHIDGLHDKGEGCEQ